MVSYQSVLGYFSSHYQPSILLAKESSAELIVKLLKVAAGLSIPTDSQKHLVSWGGALKGRVFFRAGDGMSDAEGSLELCDSPSVKVGGYRARVLIFWPLGSFRFGKPLLASSHMLTRGQKDYGLVVWMSLAAEWQGSDAFGPQLTVILILVFSSELEIIPYLKVLLWGLN